LPALTKRPPGETPAAFFILCARQALTRLSGGRFKDNAVEWRKFSVKSLNIKDPEAHRLAVAIAQQTGETMTRVVTEALRERLEHLLSRRGRASVEDLSAIAKRAAAHVKRPYLDHGELLYDEHGLPK
jgi:antitoxin VapB